MKHNQLERAGDFYLPDAGESIQRFIQRLLEQRDQSGDLPIFGAHNGRVMVVRAESTVETLFHQWQYRTFA